MHHGWFLLQIALKNASYELVYLHSWTLCLVSRKDKTFSLHVLAFFAFSLFSNSAGEICIAFKFFSSMFILNTGLFRIRMILANLVSQYRFFSIELYECRAGRLFPDRLTLTRPALHTSAFFMVFYSIARAGPYRSNDKYSYVSRLYPYVPCFTRVLPVCYS